MNEELQKRIEAILSQSDIVWGRYGCDTIEKLASRIVKAIEPKETPIFSFVPYDENI